MSDELYTHPCLKREPHEGHEWLMKPSPISSSRELVWCSGAAQLEPELSPSGEQIAALQAKLDIAVEKSLDLAAILEGHAAHIREVVAKVTEK